MNMHEAHRLDYSLKENSIWSQFAEISSLSNHPTHKSWTQFQLSKAFYKNDGKTGNNMPTATV